jgi:hypothetical protein
MAALIRPSRWLAIATLPGIVFRVHGLLTSAAFRLPFGSAEIEL